MLGPKALAIIAGLVGQAPDKIDVNEISCMAANIYHEARGESDRGMAFAAGVTLNRVASKRYPDTICGVVLQRKQFSWTHDGKIDRPKDLAQITRAIFIAYDVMTGSLLPNTQGATHYYAHGKVSKLHKWMQTFERVAVVGNHTFMRKEMRR